MEQLVCHRALMQQIGSSSLTEDRYFFLPYFEIDGAPMFNMYMSLPLQHITDIECHVRNFTTNGLIRKGVLVILLLSTHYEIDHILHAIRHQVIQRSSSIVLKSYYVQGLLFLFEGPNI